MKDSLSDAHPYKIYCSNFDLFGHAFINPILEGGSPNLASHAKALCPFISSSV